MKCILELYGKTYQSTEFTERQVTAFIAAACGATGINIRKLFQSLVNFDGLEGQGFRDYDSIESAERDLSHLLKKVFPTLDRHIDSIDTTELVTIVGPMLNALNVAPKALAAIPAEPIEKPNPLDNVWVTESVKTVDVEPIEPIEWVYPPGEITLLTPQEKEAIDYASQVSGAEPAKIRCWYVWWKAVNDGESVSTAVAIDVLRDFTKQFTEQECGRYYALVTAHLEKTAPIETPIAA